MPDRPAREVCQGGPVEEDPSRRTQCSRGARRLLPDQAGRRGLPLHRPRGRHGQREVRRDAGEAAEWRDRYPAAVTMSHYVGRYGWNSVDWTGPVPDDEVREQKISAVRELPPVTGRCAERTEQCRPGDD